MAENSGCGLFARRGHSPAVPYKRIGARRLQNRRVAVSASNAAMLFIALQQAGEFVIGFTARQLHVHRMFAEENKAAGLEL